METFGSIVFGWIRNLAWKVLYQLNGNLLIKDRKSQKYLRKKPHALHFLADSCDLKPNPFSADIGRNKILQKNWILWNKLSNELDISLEKRPYHPGFWMKICLLFSKTRIFEIWTWVVQERLKLNFRQYFERPRCSRLTYSSLWPSLLLRPDIAGDQTAMAFTFWIRKAIRWLSRKAFMKNCIFFAIKVIKRFSLWICFI